MELMEGGRTKIDRGCPITYGHLDMKPWLAEAWSNVLAGPVLGARVERSVSLKHTRCQIHQNNSILCENDVGALREMAKMGQLLGSYRFA